MSREFEPGTLKSRGDKTVLCLIHVTDTSSLIFLHRLPGNRSFVAHRFPYFRVFSNKINLIKSLSSVPHKYSPTKERISGPETHSK